MQLINADRSSSRMFPQISLVIRLQGRIPDCFRSPTPAFSHNVQGAAQEIHIFIDEYSFNPFVYMAKPIFFGPVIGIVGWVSATAAEVTIYVMQHKPIDFAWRKCLGTG
jgi:hypothetical protein